MIRDGHHIAYLQPCWGLKSTRNTPAEILLKPVVTLNFDIDIVRHSAHWTSHPHLRRRWQRLHLASSSKVTSKLPKPLLYSSLHSLPTKWAWRRSFWKCLLFCDRSSQGFEGHFVADWLTGDLTWHFSSHRLLFQAPGISTVACSIALGGLARCTAVAWRDPKYRGYHWDASLGDQFVWNLLCF